MEALLSPALGIGGGAGGAVVFTEGLDDKAIDWAKQGSDSMHTPLSPLIQRCMLDVPVSNHSSLFRNSSYISPKDLPLVKPSSGLFMPRSLVFDGSDEEESVASVPECYYANYSDTMDTEGWKSSDSDMFGNRSKGDSREEEATSARLSDESLVQGPVSSQRKLLRGLSKENLRVDVAITGILSEVRSAAPATCPDNFIFKPHEHIFDHYMLSKIQTFSTPSAPPITVDLEEESNFGNDVGNNFGTMEAPPEPANQEDEYRESVILQEEDTSVPCSQHTFESSCLNYTTSIQNAWSTFVAYEASLRLCLNAWAKHCMEAPEFLRDECAILRNAFGIQRYLLHPKGQNHFSGKHTYDNEVNCTVKGKILIKQIEVEVKKIRIIPQRPKLWATSSLKDTYMQVGVEYTKHVSNLLKNQFAMLTSSSPFTTCQEDALICSLELRSSCKYAVADSTSPVYLKPGSGDSCVLYV